MINLGGQKVRVERVFRFLIWKLSDRFFGPKGSIETKIFKKIAVFTGTIGFGPFFVVLS